MKYNKPQPVKWLIGTKKIKSTKEPINEKPMLMTAPEKVSMFFKPIRANTMDTLYKKADIKASAGAKLSYLFPEDNNITMI